MAFPRAGERLARTLSVVPAGPEAEAPLPPAPAPMKAVSDALPRDEGWAFEVKWDGMLRHPSYVGERLDVDPARVAREPFPGD